MGEIIAICCAECGKMWINTCETTSAMPVYPWILDKLNQPDGIWIDLWFCCAKCEENYFKESFDDFLNRQQ